MYVLIHHAILLIFFDIRAPLHMKIKERNKNAKRILEVILYAQGQAWLIESHPLPSYIIINKNSHQITFKHKIESLRVPGVYMCI